MDTAFKKKMPIFSFIINTWYDKPHTKYLKHWEAVWCDGISLCHYDPLALNQRQEEFKKIIAPYLAKKYKYYLKYKYNNVKNQMNNSSECGYFCIRFILYMLSGLSFKTATGFLNIAENQKSIKTFVKNLDTFEYV